MSYRNSEHYSDPTAGQALDNVEKEQVSKLIKLLKQIINRNGFELLNRIELRDKRTGRIHK